MTAPAVGTRPEPMLAFGVAYANRLDARCGDSEPCCVIRTRDLGGIAR